MARGGPKSEVGGLGGSHDLSALLNQGHCYIPRKSQILRLIIYVNLLILQNLMRDKCHIKVT